MPPTLPELHDQWILHPEGDPTAPPAGWQRRGLAGWTLDSHPNLPVIDLFASDAAPLGWLLGWAITPDARLLKGRETLSTAADSPQAAFENWLYQHGGRYACILLAKRFGRVYLDPCGTLSAVYEPQRAAVASTLTVLRQADPEAFATAMLGRPELYENHFYPAGLTPEPGVRRLLPGHYLDLEAWAAMRHWPAAPIERVGEEQVSPLVSRIAGLMAANIAGITGQRLAYLGLTAGRDSRMLLACARPAVDRVRFVTFTYGDLKRRPDIHIAQRLARRFGLEHQAVALVEPTLQQRRQYLQRIGYAGHWGKARDFDLACRSQLDTGRAWITGFGGEIGRGFYWREGDDPAIPPPPEALMARLYLPQHEGWLEAWRQWQSAAPFRDTFDLLDLLYIEQRMGCWAGPHMYGAAPFAASLSAFNHRGVLEAMMALPVAFRRRQGLAAAVLAQRWPELGDLPFQRLTGLERLSDPVKAAMRSGVGALRRGAGKALRKALGPRIASR